MPFFAKVKPVPVSESKSSIVELIFAAQTLRQYLVARRNAFLYECICGITSSDSYDRDHHHAHCPVARFDAAVEAVRKAAL